MRTVAIKQRKKQKIKMPANVGIFIEKRVLFLYRKMTIQRMQNGRKQIVF